MNQSGITLDRLFRPVKPVKVGDQALKVRALSGPEQNERSFYATGQARKLKKKMQDRESPEYQFRLGFLEELDQDNLATYLKLRFESSVRRDIEKDNPAPVYQPIPDDATDEETMAVMDAREVAKTAHQEKIDAEVKSKLDDYIAKTLNKDVMLKSREELLVMAEKSIVQVATIEQANMSFAYYGLSVSVQNEDGSNFFSSPEDAGALDNSVVFYLHRELESVNAIDPLAMNSNSPSSTD